MGPVTESGKTDEPTGTTSRLRTTDAVIDRAQAIARRRRKEPAGVIDEFIAERREDAARE